ncbi:hypothetical protein ABW21_db0201947 [Orbilia brochopaga]|nr:hypothetical protein ABW21_db0201947 [Drechslerella brochopaga]
MAEIVDAGTHKYIPYPPPPTAEERKAWKIQEFQVILAEFEDPKVAEQLPPAYVDSLRRGLAAWQNGEVEWKPNWAYLWGPEGLVAQGPAEEIWTKRIKEGTNKQHVDPCQPICTFMPTITMYHSHYGSL